MKFRSMRSSASPFERRTFAPKKALSIKALVFVRKRFEFYTACASGDCHKTERRQRAKRTFDIRHQAKAQSLNVRWMEGLATWWALEFDNISLRVCDIDRGSFAFGAVTGASQSAFHTIGFKTTANTGLVKGIDTETEVIQFPPFLPRREPPALPSLPSTGTRSKK